MTHGFGDSITFRRDGAARQTSTTRVSRAYGWLAIVLMMLTSLGGCHRTHALPAHGTLSFDASPSDEDIDLVSLNTWLLKPPYSSFTGERADALASLILNSQLSGIEIIALQEVWRPYRTELHSRIADTDSRWNIRSTSTDTDERDSGLMLLTSLNIIDSFAHHYAAASGEDGKFDKGALFVRLETADGSQFDLAITHLQADPIFAPFSGPGTRHKQLRELKSFIEKCRCKLSLAAPTPATPPLLIVGDFNIKGPRRQSEPGDWREYNRLLDILGCDGDVLDVFFERWAHRQESGQPTYFSKRNRWDYLLSFCGLFASTKRLDYVLCQDPALRFQFTDADVRSFVLGESSNEFISDHDALQLAFRLK